MLIWTSFDINDTFEIGRLSGQILQEVLLFGHLGKVSEVALHNSLKLLVWGRSFGMVLLCGVLFCG